MQPANHSAHPSYPRAIVLAAGRGKRLQSEQCDLPKVLREADGKSLLSYVLEALSFLPPENILAVIGYRWEQVRAALDPRHPHALQTEQLGTGHAVAMAADWIWQADTPVLVCCGDMPLIRKETYQRLFAAGEASGDPCTLLVDQSPEVLPYGRILRLPDGSFDRIVEDRDCTPEQKRIREYNAGVYVFEPRALLDGLAALRNCNAQQEYYLTDVPGFLRDRGAHIGLVAASGARECLGVNTQEDLDRVTALLRTGESL